MEDPTTSGGQEGTIGLPKDIEEQARKEGCGISTSQSTSCRTINGERKCEEEVTYFKRCPGKQPELLYRNKTQTTGEPPQMENGHTGGRSFPSLPSIFGDDSDMFGRQDESFSEFDKIFKAMERRIADIEQNFRDRGSGSGSKVPFAPPKAATTDASPGPGQPKTNGNSPPVPWANEVELDKQRKEAQRAVNTKSGTYV